MLNKICYKLSAAAMAGMIIGSSGEAYAGAGNTFSSIAKNITTSTELIPGLLTGMAYLIGILLGVLGILKIKDHVENPTQTPLKDGAIRLASGGALFAIPIIFESMFETVGSQGQTTTAAQLTKVKFAVQ